MPITLGPGEERQLDIGLTPIPVPNASLFGYITDADTLLPIVGALVELIGAGDYSTITNSDGYYQILEIAPGVYSGQITAAGYEPATF